MGVASNTDGHSSIMASQSAGVNVIEPPEPRLAPWPEPGKTNTTFVPMPCSSLCNNPFALCPSETIVVTAAIPITTPSTVRPARILFFASARRATRNVSMSPMM